MKLNRNFFVIFFIVVFLLLIFFSFLINNKSEESKTETGLANLDVIKLTDSTCQNCFDLDELLNVLKKEEIAFRNIVEIDINSDKGQEAVKDFAIIKAPILIITGEIEKNQDFLKLWKGFGEKRENYLISDVFPPYKDLKTEEIIGLVNMTIIKDATCTECYDPKIHNAYLKTEGIVPAETKELDVADKEAQELISKYNITKIPTIILSPEAKNYENFTTSWKKDGIVSEDGYYIFMNPEKLGTYKDLEKNEINKQL